MALVVLALALGLALALVLALALALEPPQTSRRMGRRLQERVESTRLKG